MVEAIVAAEAERNRKVLAKEALAKESALKRRAREEESKRRAEQKATMDKARDLKKAAKEEEAKRKAVAKEVLSKARALKKEAKDAETKRKDLERQQKRAEKASADARKAMLQPSTSSMLSKPTLNNTATQGSSSAGCPTVIDLRDEEAMGLLLLAGSVDLEVIDRFSLAFSM
jgi:flagellar biosynthesis GTPase FlhF